MPSICTYVKQQQAGLSTVMMDGFLKAVVYDQKLKDRNTAYLHHGATDRKSHLIIYFNID
jgi:hypothetical protein